MHKVVKWLFMYLTRAGPPGVLGTARMSNALRTVALWKNVLSAVCCNGASAAHQTGKHELARASRGLCCVSRAILRNSVLWLGGKPLVHNMVPA